MMKLENVTVSTLVITVFVQPVPLKMTLAERVQVPVIKAASKVADNASPVERVARLPGSRISVPDQNDILFVGSELSVKFNSKTEDISITPLLMTLASNV